MKLGSMSKMLAGVALALVITGSGTVLANPAPAPSKQDQKNQKKQESKYPDATRKAPKLDLTKQKDADNLNKGLDAVNAGDEATAKQILQPLADGSGSKSKYVQVMALQGLANMQYNDQDLKGAIATLKKALDIGVMPNDTYFDLTYELAQFYAGNKQEQQALTTLKKWRTEGKRETADSYGLEGVLDYRLGKYKEAITAIQKAKSMTDQPKESWNQVLAASYAETGQGDQAIAMAKKQLAADPGDASTRHNLIVLLMQGNKYDEALKLMEDARSKGELKTSSSYANMAKLYLMAGQNSDSDPKPFADKANSVLEEGKSKGIVKADHEYYMLKGNASLVGGDTHAALASFKKAASMGSDGEADLRVAQLEASENNNSAARSAAKKAISKGTKHKGKAWMVIAKAERAMKNKPAAVQAMQKAAEDPETRSQAQDWLKKSGH